MHTCRICLLERNHVHNQEQAIETEQVAYASPLPLAFREEIVTLRSAITNVWSTVHIKFL